MSLIFLWRHLIYHYLLLFQDENQGEFNSSETDDDIDLPGQSCPFQIKAIHITEIALIQKNKASRTFQVLCLCLNWWLNSWFRLTILVKQFHNWSIFFSFQLPPKGFTVDAWDLATRTGRKKSNGMLWNLIYFETAPFKNRMFTEKWCPESIEYIYSVFI